LTFILDAKYCIIIIQHARGYAQRWLT